MPHAVSQTVAAKATRTGQALVSRIKNADPEHLVPAGRRLSTALIEVTRAASRARAGAGAGDLRAALVELVSATNAARQALRAPAPTTSAATEQEA